MHRFGDKGVHIFPKSICPKLNLIVWLEFEPVHYDITVEHVSHYAWVHNQLNTYVQCNWSENWISLRLFHVLYTDVIIVFSVYSSNTYQENILIVYYFSQ